VSAGPQQIATALAAAARAINRPDSLGETLDVIVRAAQQTVPGFDHVGISTAHRNGRIETEAGTDQLVWELDDLQYSISEGPCVDAIRVEPIVRVENARHEQRWPNYMPRAVHAGLRAQLALRLYLEQDALGGINFYSTESDTISEDAVQIAELFATHASIALGRARHEHQLSEAISTRKVIGQAIGIVMERYQISEDRAFHFLVRASSTTNVKLRDVAAEVVATSNARFSDER
jgi:GAF domain-containing protein